MKTRFIGIADDRRSKPACHWYERLSVSQRVPREERLRIATALQTPAGMSAMAKLGETYKIGNLSAASAQASAVT